MLQYNRVTEVTDHGPFVVKLILPLPCEAGSADITPDTFGVYAEVRDEKSGEVRVKKDAVTGIEMPVKGYPQIVAAYPCDEKGDRRLRGENAALELGFDILNNRIFAEPLINVYVENRYRVTQLKPLPGTAQEPEIPTVGLVYDELGEEFCPDTQGWKVGVSSDEECPLRYQYFEPEAEGKIPLVLWLHGAGEGGSDIRMVNTGNRITALSGGEIQKKLGGAAVILAPQSPTVWMNDGKEILTRANESIYVRPMKALVDEFIAARPHIDTSRIYVGGPSNGGFMTIRMLRDYPGFFAAGIGVCTPWYEENLTEETLCAVRQTPLWLVHCKKDTVVPVWDTALPLYHALKARGADVHMSLFDKLVDLTGRYRDELGRPMEYFGHHVWIHAYNDDVMYDLDGSRVTIDGNPVTLWEWVGKQHR